MLVRPSKNMRSRNCRFGAATIEMALVAPFLLVLIFASIEFARMMMVRQALTNAAREGSRHACLATTMSDDSAIQLIQERLEGVINSSVDAKLIDISIEPPFSSSLESQTQITTTIEVGCSDVSWLPPMFYRNAKIHVETSMYRE